LELQFAVMSTLVQIESEVVDLPPQEQWTLLTWLQTRLASATAPEQANLRSQQEWLEELAELREKTRTGLQGARTQDILDELREERC
jgi:hypothetical protein